MNSSAVCSLFKAIWEHCSTAKAADGLICTATQTALPLAVQVLRPSCSQPNLPTTSCGDEVGYTLNFGDLDAEVAYDLDHRGFSGQLRYNVGFAGYDFTVGVEGVTSPIDDDVLELLADDYYGLTAMGGVDFGDIEFGLSFGQERVSNWMLSSVDNETDVKRQFASLGASYTAIDAIKLSIDHGPRRHQRRVGLYRT